MSEVKCSTSHHIGCECHEAKWAEQLAQAERERDEMRAKIVFMGDANGLMSRALASIKLDSEELVQLRARVERLSGALENLMQAHRDVFMQSLVAAQFAAEPGFVHSWRDAEDALGAVK